MVEGPCPRCKGERSVPRTVEEDGTDADVHMHPVLAITPKTCPRCGGMGRVALSVEEIVEKLKENVQNP